MHLFLTASASVRSISFLSFIVPIFAWNVPLVSLIFLKRSPVFPILLFSSISLHCSLKKGFFSLLAILWNSAFRWLYLSFSLGPPSLLQMAEFHSFDGCIIFHYIYSSLYWFFSKIYLFFSWRLIALQNCVSFCQTSTCISHRYTYVPSILNHLPPYPTPLSCYRALIWVPWVIQHTHHHF